MFYALFPHIHTPLLWANYKIQLRLKNLIFNSIVSCFPSVLSGISYQLYGLCFCFSLYGHIFQHCLMALGSDMFHLFYCSIVLDSVIIFLLHFRNIYNHFYLPIDHFIDFIPPETLYTFQINKFVCLITVSLATLDLSLQFR
jgi:hypothetical protein